jgi:3-hydroxyisobutyrate dehydrogenase
MIKAIGFIGLGNMGFHMANNLVKKGYSLVTYDINDTVSKRLKDLHKDKVKIAKNPKEIASQVKNVITMLPSSPQVQEVLSSTENGFFFCYSRRNFNY